VDSPFPRDWLFLREGPLSSNNYESKHMVVAFPPSPFPFFFFGIQGTRCGLFFFLRIITPRREDLSLFPRYAMLLPLPPFSFPPRRSPSAFLFGFCCASTPSFPSESRSHYIGAFLRLLLLSSCWVFFPSDLPTVPSSLRVPNSSSFFFFP